MDSYNYFIGKLYVGTVTLTQNGWTLQTTAKQGLQTTLHQSIEEATGHLMQLAGSAGIYIKGVKNEF